ncbi:hypothetical protein E2R68_13410 [Psychromonas sp. RZ22]|uniref:integrase arm-type DNA-binding domain-containing protein n=1 Tax=Psychromonas algarum TaxID=2555643 RepID=UPI001067F01A|nr:integrase arm-type DNA-binding domain-containing protein [Psychromonas sp. RZ22]TEW53184.1 hypothetical protein E2R68_13410 [Psychromonas sp. RZ22]
MAKTVPPLNDTQIKNAKPKDKEYNLGDSLGLTLKIKPNGTKLWWFNYLRPITKQRANLSLGNNFIYERYFTFYFVAVIANPNLSHS